MMLLAKDQWGQTASHMAAVTNSVQAVTKIWEWAETVTSALGYSLLISQDKDIKNCLAAGHRGRSHKVGRKNCGIGLKYRK
jgi:hypothetical protein